MYEYVLRRPDNPDEILIGDLDSVGVGAELEIRNRRWTVVATEPSDNAEVQERKILVPVDERQWYVRRTETVIVNCGCGCDEEVEVDPDWGGEDTFVVKAEHIDRGYVRVVSWHDGYAVVERS